MTDTLIAVWLLVALIWGWSMIEDGDNFTWWTLVIIALLWPVWLLLVAGYGIHALIHHAWERLG